MRSGFRLCVCVCLITSCGGWFVPPVVAEAPSTAVALAQSATAPGGLCALVSPVDEQLAVELSQQGRFVVDLLVPEATRRDQLRRQLRAAGRYGDVTVHQFDGARLPYTDDLLNLIVVGSFAEARQQGLTLNEVVRVVAPLGSAWLRLAAEGPVPDGLFQPLEAEARALGCTARRAKTLPAGWVHLTRNWPDDMDQWTHFLHGADNNPVAHDTVVGPPKHYRWTGGPVWLRSHETDSSISTMVTAAGRMFYIVDEGPISMSGDPVVPDKWFLVGRDAFNGVVLWKVPIRRWGWREWKYNWFATRPGDYPFDIRKRLVAVGDKVYATLGYRAPVSELDARTGQVLRTLPGTENTSEILLLDGTLYVSLHEEDQLRVAALDVASGKTLWRSDKTYRGSTTDYLRWTAMHGSVRAPVLSPAANLATDGKSVALIDDDQIVVLDAQTGQQRWNAAFPLDDRDASAGNISAKGKLWNGTMIVYDGVVLHASPSVLGAFSAADGKLLWKQPKKFIGHLWYEWKDVFVIEGLVWTWSDEFEQALIRTGAKSQQRQQWPRSVRGYDLHTGELKQDVPVGNIFRTHHHHRCYRNKATTRYILASRRGTEFVDLQNGKHTVDNWVRGTCHVGMMPANGLQYVPPHPCQCYIQEKLVGMNVLAAQLARPDVQLDEAARLESGPAVARAAALSQVAPESIQDQWPAFRHDAARTGSAATRIPDDADLLWTADVGGKLTPPTVAGGRLFVAQTDQHHVVCIRARTGELQWEFAAGARVDSPPTCAGGLVVFGCRDGSVYCLDAATGQLAWRYHVAPSDRWISAYGQLESVWPVHGSVLVQDGIVYAAAGRSSELDGGIYLVGLNLATGQPMHTHRLEGPHYTVDNVEENYNLPMGALPDILTSDGEHIFMRSLAFDQQLHPVSGKPEIEVSGGYLEDSYFKRIPWRIRSGEYGRVLVRDGQMAYYMRQFDTLQGLDPTVFFKPGKAGYLLFAQKPGNRSAQWQTRIPIRIRAMVVANDRLAVAGPPDVVERQDPLGAFEGRDGGRLWVYHASTGELASQHDLEYPPVFNGAAAAQERLFLVDTAGRIVCFGTP